MKIEILWHYAAKLPFFGFPNLKAETSVFSTSHPNPRATLALVMIQSFSHKVPFHRHICTWWGDPDATSAYLCFSRPAADMSRTVIAGFLSDSPEHVPSMSLDLRLGRRKMTSAFMRPTARKSFNVESPSNVRWNHSGNDFDINSFLFLWYILRVVTYLSL